MISSGPSLVSRASTSCFSMWMDVNLSSRTMRSLRMIASSKLYPSQLMKATSTLCPNASSPCDVDELSARMSPISTRSWRFTIGCWLMHVPWLLRTNFLSLYSCRSPLSSTTTMRLPVTSVTTPAVRDQRTWPLSTATRFSMPVPTNGASGLSNGTACLCMFDPSSARPASSCSRNGISAVETLTSCIGETSM